MSYNIIVNCSIGNISNETRNDIVEKLKEYHFKDGIDFKLDDSWDLILINLDSIWAMIEVVKKELEIE